MDCIICDAHIQTGNALVVLKGEVDGAGRFTAKDVVGGLCELCGDPSIPKGLRFPFVIGVD